MDEKEEKKAEVQQVPIPAWIGKFPFRPEEKRFIVIRRGDELSGFYGFEGHQVALRRFVSLDQFTVSQWTLTPGNYYEPAGQHNYSKYMDVIYPMLYPSHYTNDEYRISHPYETVREGVANSLKRCQNTRIVAYIQGFTWKVDRSGKSMKEYLEAQIQAVEDAGGHGWVIWNAENKYQESYSAISSFDNSRKKRLSKAREKGDSLL